MKATCVLHSRLRALAGVTLVACVALTLTSCTTHEPVAAGSNLPRSNALALAKQIAFSVGGSVFTVAPTGSMKPTLDENSVVAVEKVAFAELRRGDIVVYRNFAGLPVVHRLYAPTAQGWVVLGDNNPSIDREAVTPANLLGRVCAIFYTTPGGAVAPATAFAQSGNR